MYDHIITELNQIIDTEEQKIINCGISGQVAIIELCRAIDYFLIGVRYYDAKKKMSEDDIDLYNNCWPYAIKLFYDNSMENEGVPLYSSHNSFASLADMILQHSGRIYTLKKLLDLYKTGVYSLNRTSTDKYQFKILPLKTIGAEYFEVLEFEKQNQAIIQSQQIKYDELNLEKGEISTIMSSLVFRWRDDFIGYSADSRVDTYYYRLATLEAERIPGINEFPDDLVFNGIQFELYKKAVIAIISWSLKHMNFCFELKKKYRELDIRNLLIKFQPKEFVTDNLANAINADNNTANKILSTFVLNRENIDYHCSGNIPPPFIEIGKNQLLYSNVGCMIDPLNFMLNELNRQAPKEWDKAISVRESTMRDELYKLFLKNDLIKIPRNFNLKDKNKILTDIDACIIDPDNGEIAIFQIKWQEPYGRVMTERYSKKKNFLYECNNWINTVDGWFKNNEYTELSSIIGEKRSLLKRVKNIRYFVFGRNSTHFSGNDCPDERAAWGVWPQVVNIMLNNKNSENPIKFLFKALKENSPINKKVTILNKSELCFGDKSISILPLDY